MENKVSIIVPVYNCENSIERCLRSILTQTYQDIEVIAIDDGSKDNSGKICDKLAKEDDRLIVVHQENSGVSKTRNNALKLATGNYIQFVDSDDYLADYATKSLVDAANKNGADLVIADFYRVIKNRISTKGKIKSKKVFSLQEYANHMIKDPADFYYGVLWNKLYKRSIIDKYHLTMLEDINWCEDFLFNLEYVKYCKVFFAIQIPIYYYFKNENSLSNNKMTAEKIVAMKHQTFDEFNKFYQQVLTEEEYQAYRPLIYRYLVEYAKDGGTNLFNVALGQESITVMDYALKNDSFTLKNYRFMKGYMSLLEPLTYKYKLNYRQLSILELIGTDNIVSKEELAEILNVSKQQMVIELQLLEFKNLIEVNSYEKDKRYNEVTFSQEGMMIVNEIKKTVKEYEKLINSDLSSEEKKQLEKISKKIDDNIKKRLSTKVREI